MGIHQTEYETVKYIEKLIEKLRERKFYEYGEDIFEEALLEAIIALEKVKQYSDIGPVAWFRILDERYEDIKDELRGIITPLVNDKIFKEAVKAIKEVKACRAIGTIEEFKALKEKSEPKKPIRKPNHDWTHEVITCPTCNGYLSLNEHHCRCGQKIEME